MVYCAIEYYTARERMSTDAQNYTNESYKEAGRKKPGT